MDKKRGNKNIRKRSVRRALCGAVLCSQLLCGCGAEMLLHIITDTAVEAGERADNEDSAKLWQSPSRAAEQESSAGTWAQEMPQSSAEASEEETGNGQGTAREILAELITDEGFQERVWYAADLEEDDTKEMILQKLEQCQSLELREPPYGDSTFSLEGLSYVPNLKSLSIRFSEWDDSRIEDFAPIARLTQLEELYLSCSTEEELDLSFLAELDTVVNLYLPDCRLKNIDFLENMPQLKRLSLYNTPVDDLAVLKKLPGLVELALGGNEGAKNIEAVGTLRHMQDLGLQSCGIQDISFLSGLSELRGLNLNGNSVTDLTPLAGLDKLERLGAADNGLCDITPIANLTKLFDLALDQNEITDISVLSGLNNLSQLGISDNRITDLSPLEGMESLMYAAVFGNPCSDLGPVLQVPLLGLERHVITQEEKDWVTEWIAREHSEINEFECIDCVKGDLNEDGREDTAFVLEGKFEHDGYMTEGARRLFVLLKQADGSYAEAGDIPSLQDKYSGGMRGDPYQGIYMGPGYLAVKSGWGSSTGETDTEIYSCRGDKLQMDIRISVGDCSFAEGYDVKLRHGKNDAYVRYAVALDGYRMVRVDLGDLEHPVHKAFPTIDLFYMSYVVHTEERSTSMTSGEALDSCRESLFPESEKEELPYAPWQKENYELLLGMALPDYFYTLSGQENYMCYDGLTFRDGEAFHVIQHIIQKEKTEETTYLVNDITGDITQE